MKRFPLIVMVLLALVSVPESALGGDDRCRSCDRAKYWWVEIATGGNCYVRFRRSPGPNFSAKYLSPMAAYIAIARKPACYRTAEWLMQYNYIRRAVN
jgi:hypothetical protein